MNIFLAQYNELFNSLSPHKFINSDSIIFIESLIKNLEREKNKFKEIKEAERTVIPEKSLDRKANDIFNESLKYLENELKPVDKDALTKLWETTYQKLEIIIPDLRSLNNKIGNWDKDIKNMEVYIIDEFIKFAKNNNGIININDENHIKVCNSLLLSDPDSTENQGRAVISLKSTVKAISKEVDNLSNYESNKLKEILTKELVLLEKNITNRLSNPQEVQALVSKRLTSKLFERVMFMDNNQDEELIPIHPDKRSKIVQTIISHTIELPSKLMCDLLHKTKSSKIKALEEHIINESTKYFHGDKNHCININKEVNEASIKEYTNSINGFIQSNYKSFRQAEADRCNDGQKKSQPEAKCNIL